MKNTSEFLCEKSRKIVLSIGFATSIILSLDGCSKQYENVLAETPEWRISVIDSARVQILVSYNKRTSESKKLLRTNLDSRMFNSLAYDTTSVVHKDSIRKIDKATILPWPQDTLYMVLEDCGDVANPNTHSFVFNECSDSLTHLPTNTGLMGITSEDFLLVMESREYHNNGGAYNIISMYDHRARKIATINMSEK